MDIVSRMKEFMDYYSLTSSQFADSAGIPRPTLSQLLNGRNKSNEGAKKVSSDIIRKIHEAFPSLNVMWLLFGDGDMVTDSNIEISAPQNRQNMLLAGLEPTENERIQNQLDFDDDFRNLDSKKISDTQNHIATVADITKQEEANASRGNMYTNPEQKLPPIIHKADKSKKVQSIMVFYDDNSFEIFKPSE